MNQDAVRVLVEFVATHIQQSTLPEQIKIYSALGQILPTSKERADASNIAVILSRAAALQLDFTEQLFRRPTFITVRQPRRSSRNSETRPSARQRPNKETQKEAAR